MKAKKRCPVRWLLLVAVMACASGCSPRPEFERYSPYMGKYSLDVPKNWIRESSNRIDDRPQSFVRFVGAVTARSYGSPHGAVVKVHKAYRLRRDHLGSDAEFKEHQNDMSRLDEKYFKSLASNLKEGTLAGLPARIFIEDFSENISGTIVREALSMRSETVIARTDDAYYALTYIATAELFPIHYAAFERMRSSFQIVPERIIPKTKTPPFKSRGLELTLSLGRPTWKAPEMIWYLLSAKNTSLRPIYITDSFWWDQYALAKNQRDKSSTYFEVHAPSGKTFEASFAFEWGFHGEFAFWTNACGEGRTCGDSADIALEIMPGRQVSAAPSIVAPIQKPNQSVMALTDARIDCRGSESARKDSQELFDIVGKFKNKIGQPQDMGDICGPSAPLYPGLRILEGFHFNQPGRYRIRAVFDEGRDHTKKVKSNWVTFDLLPGEKHYIAGLISEKGRRDFPAGTVIWPMFPISIALLAIGFTAIRSSGGRKMAMAHPPLLGYNMSMGSFDEPVGKVVGRRAGVADPVADAAILLDTISRLNEHGLCRRGVWRFSTFQEADEWALREMTRVPAPRG